VLAEKKMLLVYFSFYFYGIHARFMNVYKKN